MEVTECPADRSLWKRSFDIYPVGLTEKLRVNLDLACECDCELSTASLEVCVLCNTSVVLCSTIVIFIGVVLLFDML